MHEYGLVGALIERVEAEARAHGAWQVARVHVGIGAMAGVDPELLARAYETFRERTVCAHAPLEVRRVAARWACPRCEGTLERGAILRCPQCGIPARLVEGEDLILERIELEMH